MLGIPAVTFISQTNVTISYEPPANSHEFRDITYMISYRKYREKHWAEMRHISCTTQTISGLDEGSVYEFKVAAKYEGGQWGQESGTIRVRTESNITGKY